MYLTNVLLIIPLRKSDVKENKGCYIYENGYENPKNERQASLLSRNEVSPNIIHAQ